MPIGKKATRASSRPSSRTACWSRGWGAGTAPRAVSSRATIRTRGSSYGAGGRFPRPASRAPRPGHTRPSPTPGSTAAGRPGNRLRTIRSWTSCTSAPGMPSRTTPRFVTAPTVCIRPVLSRCGPRPANSSGITNPCQTTASTSTRLPRACSPTSASRASRARCLSTRTRTASSTCSIAPTAS